MWRKAGGQADKKVFSEGSNSSNAPIFSIGTTTDGKVQIFIRDNSNSTLLSANSADTAFDG